VDKLLDGVRVLDVSTFSPVRFGTTVMADLGATVIQIDKPAAARAAGPLDLLDSPEHPRWLWHSRNKRSVVINLKQDEGRDVFYDLLATADVVVEGFAAGAAARLGIDYETLRERKPGIVYASVSGFGQAGPYAHLSGHEQNYQAMAGLTAASAGPGVLPQITPAPIADSVASLYSVIALLAALRRRDATGQGAYIDISIQDTVLSLFGYNANYYWQQGITQPRTIREFGGHPGVGVYQTADGGAVQVNAVEPWAWDRLCRSLDADELRADFDIDEDRVPAVREHLARIIASRTRDEWAAFNASENVGISPVLGLAELLSDEHIRSRGMVNEVTHPTLGVIPQLATPITVDGSVASSDWLPQPGDHTDSVLAELGYTAERRDELRRKDAIQGTAGLSGAATR
jgi:crotonobetainyl-CoA:carnitine CoA-transferase CaiB-like acyl-CoA transferase